MDKFISTALEKVLKHDYQLSNCQADQHQIERLLPPQTDSGPISRYKKGQ